MPHLFVILVLVSLSLAGGSGLDAADGARSWADGLMPAGIGVGTRLVLALSVFAAIGVAGWAGVSLCVRALDRGRPRAVVWAWRVLTLTRLAALLWHVGAVFVVGFLGVVRSAVGDPVILDELLASAPAFATLLWTYRLAHPLERRIRDAMLMRALDEGRPVYAFPGPWRFVASSARNNLAIMFVPLVLILAWSESLDRLLPMTGLLENAEGLLASAGPPAIRLAGSVAIFALIPPVMTRVWDTVPIPPGELRDELERLARTHRIRLRRFLIWRTHGSMLNGAVIGITPWLRYIVLTDALLESLSEAEVEAVAAHEVAHVRMRHMLWLALAVVGSALFFGEGAAVAMERVGLPQALAFWGGAVGSLAAVLLVLGAVSRRFEWQADAFAARHLSDAESITEEGAGAMSSALGRVARLNGIPESRFTWRHGSIATRRRRLRALVGCRGDRLPIDRRVRRVMALTTIVFAAGVWIGVAAYAGYWPYAAAVTPEAGAHP